MRLGRDEVDALGIKWADRSPVELLRWAHAMFGARLAILTGMQQAGAILCHMADQAGLACDVLFVDTGLLHAQTLAARDRLVATHESLRVITLTPARSFGDQTREEGLLYLSKEGQERCCDLRKSAPLRSVRGRYDAFVSALRRSEGGARSNVGPFALDPEMNVLRIHPLASTSNEGLARYVAAHPDVVRNELHAMGFPTIGCFPCTTPVRPDEPERAGRWRHLADVAYCGINPTDRRGAPPMSIELDERYRTAFDAA